MRVNQMLVCRSAALVVLSLAAVSLAAEPSSSTKLDNIQIENFGKVNDNYYRGAQPEDGDYADLAALGIRTVIDLTRDVPEEQGLVERAGMKFYRIPMTTSQRPSETAITTFLDLVNDPANQPVYVHCQGGRHRTGVMTAVYRMTDDGWTAAHAYAEMKQFNFEGFPSHETLKNFVYNYHAQIDRPRVAAGEPNAAAVTTR
jgi:tyrosine-protein phosphatase SIW14